MFQASHTPYNEGAEKLQNLFHIHSGGGERAIEYQMQTFKALCESATFDQAPAATTTGGVTKEGGTAGGRDVSHAGAGLPASININLHIHLPENKSRRDYEDMIEDIGRHIFGRPGTGESK
jgi:hypothetical protein